MKIHTWNIRHGGKKSEIDNIIKSFKRHNADIIVVTEFRENDNAEKIKNDLKQSGWIYQFSSLPPKKQNGILILSKVKFENKNQEYSLPEAIHRWVDIYIPEENLSILGVHIPGYSDKWDKKEFWKKLIEFGKESVNENYIIIGDFNTGFKIDCEGTPFKLSEYMEELVNLGWVDAWRYFYKETKDFTWYSNVNNGFRIDYAFTSKPTTNYLFNAYHSHNERIKKYSDHSALIIELDKIK